MLLRDVELGDVEAYLRMRCDPTMMADLGGPLPRAGVEAQLARDVRVVAAQRAWIRMIVPDPAAPAVVAGTVTLWSHDEPDGPISEIGWMVLPEYQRRGIASWAVRTLLAEAARSGRWGVVHAFPAVGNAASNAICRSLGFTLVDSPEVEFAGRLLRTNHWSIDPVGTVD